MIRGAMNEGKSTPLNVRITGKITAKARKVAENIQREVSNDRRRRRLPASCSGSTIPSTSSKSTGPRPPTWD